MSATLGDLLARNKLAAAKALIAGAVAGNFTGDVAEAVAEAMFDELSEAHRRGLRLVQLVDNDALRDYGPNVAWRFGLGPSPSDFD